MYLQGCPAGVGVWIETGSGAGAGICEGAGAGATQDNLIIMAPFDTPVSGTNRLSQNWVAAYSQIPIKGDGFLQTRSQRKMKINFKQ